MARHCFKHDDGVLDEDRIGVRGQGFEALDREAGGVEGGARERRAQGWPRAAVADVSWSRHHEVDFTYSVRYLKRELKQEEATDQEALEFRCLLHFRLWTPHPRPRLPIVLQGPLEPGKFPLLLPTTQLLGFLVFDAQTAHQGQSTQQALR